MGAVIIGVLLSYPWLMGVGVGLLPILFRNIRLMELTDGTLYLSHTPSARSLSRISHAKSLGLSLCTFWYAWLRSVLSRVAYFHQWLPVKSNRFRCIWLIFYSHIHVIPEAGGKCHMVLHPVEPARLFGGGSRLAGGDRWRIRLRAGSPPQTSTVLKWKKRN
mgnify:CR=1 FL=1